MKLGAIAFLISFLAIAGVAQAAGSKVTVTGNKDTNVTFERPAGDVVKLPLKDDEQAKLVVRVDGPNANDRKVIFVEGSLEDAQEAANLGHQYRGDRNFKKLGGGKYRSEYAVKWQDYADGREHYLTVVVFPADTTDRDQTPTYATLRFLVIDLSNHK